MEGWLDGGSRESQTSMNLHSRWPGATGRINNSSLGIFSSLFSPSK